MPKQTKSTAKSASTAKKTTKKRSSKRKGNLNRLLTAMNKLSIDAVDKEVIKRFKIVIDSLSEDITKNLLNQILEGTSDFNINTVPEIVQPYVKHYLFMKKRNEKNEKKK